MPNRLDDGARSAGTIGGGRGAGELAVLAAGLGCWLATLLLYSEAITPFQRFAGIGDFVGDLAPLSLLVACVACACVGARALRGGLLGRGALVAGAALHVVACLAFAALSVSGLGTLAGPVRAAVVWALALAAGAGAVGTALAWGRRCRALDLRASLLAVGGAGLVAALAGLLLARLPATADVALFTLAALVAAVIPLWRGGSAALDGRAADDARGREAAGARGASGDARTRALPARERLVSLAVVAAPAMVGLVAFAFIMGTMRDLIVSTFGLHLGVLALDALALVALAAAPAHRGLVRMAHRSLLPVLAVVLLAEMNVTAALLGGSALDMALTYLLYTLAALLTLATVAAIAHAGEFPADLVVAAALGAFSLASLAGLRSAEIMSADAVRVGVTVITTAYAFAMALLATVRSGRSDDVAAALPLDGEDALADGPGTRADSRRDAPVEDPATRLGRRCAELARDCGLTAREAEVLAIMAEGHASGYVSEVLYISPNTVRTHVRNIYRKLGVSSREEVITLARR